MANLILRIPTQLAEKKKLQRDLLAQVNELKKNLTLENETQIAQIGDFLKALDLDIEEHQKHLRTAMPIAA
ncbi:hypothetical protein HYV31_03945 [candidate division WWE3 bacterium]|nr:hypothetical protein [candidate division WWE3 bacterium]